MEPAIFSMRSFFETDEEERDSSEIYVQRIHEFPDHKISVREFDFHALNANLLWPGSISFATWLNLNQRLIKNKNILEIGSGTGALAIYLKLKMNCRVTTCDYDDVEIENNIAHNCILNNISKLPHIRHTWGENFPLSNLDFDLIIASDILLYVKQYPQLIQTLQYLLSNYSNEKTKTNTNSNDELISKFSISSASEGKKHVPEMSMDQVVEFPSPCFLMSWRRRLPKEDENLFFEKCFQAGLKTIDLGSRMYCIFT